MRLVLLAASLVLTGSALASDTSTDAAGNAAAPAGARVFFESPRDGATVGRDVHLVFGASGIRVAPATDTSPGSGHHHLLIDVKHLPPLDAPIPADAQHIHYGKGQTEADVHLSPGEHTLQLDFADYRHMQFNPPLVSQKITIHVKR